jgi:hypothetical protein
MWDQSSRLPSLLHFLLALHQQPSRETHTYAEDLLFTRRHPVCVIVFSLHFLCLTEYSAQAERQRLTWEAIVTEDPLTGPDWEGIDDSAAGIYETDSEDNDSLSSSSPSSPSSEVDVIIDSKRPANGAANLNHIRPTIVPDFDGFEAVQKRQYWRPGWKIDHVADSIGNYTRCVDHITTLIGSIPAASLSDQRLSDDPSLVYLDSSRQRYIAEVDAFREVLQALGGRPSILFSDSGSGAQVRLSLWPVDRG